jgi:hypothetical protein
MLAWLLLAGRRIGVRQVSGALLALALLSTAFLAWDLSRPPESHTHLARLYENMHSTGLEVLWDTIERKLATNLNVLRSTIWPYTFAVAASLVGWELVSSQRRRRLRAREPQVHAGLLGGLIVSSLGFLVNDSGIVIPAVILPFLASLIVLVRRAGATAPQGRSL